MAWVTPKTNWVADDFFNATDWNRIVGNLTYLHDRASNFSWFYYQSELDIDDKTTASMLYASEFNELEDKIALANSMLYQLPTGTKPTYAVNGSTPTYEELNRIELLLKQIYDTMDRVEAEFCYSGTFYSGQ